MCSKKKKLQDGIHLRWGHDKPEVGWGRCVCGAPLVVIPCLLVCVRTGDAPHVCAYKERGDKEMSDSIVEDAEWSIVEVRSIYLAQVEGGPAPVISAVNSALLLSDAWIGLAAALGEEAPSEEEVTGWLQEIWEANKAREQAR